MNLLVIISNIIMLGVFFLQKSYVPPQIPLFYSKQVGEDQVGEWWMIFIIPICMNIFIFINFFVIKKFFPANEFISRTLQVANVLIVLSFTFIFVKITLLITL